MYTPDQLRDMPAHEFAELLEPMSRGDLTDLLIYLQGYSPDGTACALNFSDRINAGRAERAAEAGRTAGAAPVAVNPPHHVLPTGERPCQAPGNKNAGYICTAQDGHDGPDHIAYKHGGGEYHRWPVADDAPVITDSGRTCDQANPETGAWCHQSGPHDEHRDTNGDAWAADDEPACCGSERKLFDGPLYQCDLPLGHEGLHSVLTPTGAFIAEWSNDVAAGVHTPSGYQPASVAS